MAKWRKLEEYTPFARTLVEYMWEQRPPLVPNQFAERMGVRKQALSTWLNSDAVPAPPIVVRLAREMEIPVSQLFAVAGYAPSDDPLLDRQEAWAYVRAQIEAASTADMLAAIPPHLPSADGAVPVDEYLAVLLRLVTVLAEHDRLRPPIASSPVTESALLDTHASGEGIPAGSRAPGAQSAQASHDPGESDERASADEVLSAFAADT